MLPVMHSIRLKYVLVVLLFIFGFFAAAATVSQAALENEQSITVSDDRRTASSGDDPAGGAEEQPFKVPPLGDIVPLSAELSGRLASLEGRIKDGLDIAVTQEKFDKIVAMLKLHADLLQRLKTSTDYRYSRLVKLREAITIADQDFATLSASLRQSINQLVAWRNTWSEEETRWKEWALIIGEEGDLDQLRETFTRTQSNIDRALKLVRPELETMLAVQEEGGHIQETITALTAEVDSLIADERRRGLYTTSPPMFSEGFASQFGWGLWYAFEKGLDEITWPDRQFFHRHGWVVLLQGILSIIVMVSIYRQRPVLRETGRWQFLAARPLAAGLFSGTMATIFIYEYTGVPNEWRLVYTVLGGFSFARLSEGLVGTSWQKQFIYALIVALTMIWLLEVIGFPLPLFRLFIVGTTLAGIVLCLRWRRENSRRQGSGLHTWLLRMIAFVLSVILIAELWGRDTLAQYLFSAMMDSVVTVLVFMMFMYIVHGGLEWVLNASPLRIPSLFQSDGNVVSRQIFRLIDMGVFGFVLLPGLLMIWGVYDNLKVATLEPLTFGFDLGAQRISAGLLIVTAAIVYGSFLLSWIFQKLLMEEVLVRRSVEKGVRVSMGRLVHYVIIIVGLLLAFSTLGFEITKLTIMLSALGVGIGFGLQGIVNNFISGLILLFERPVRVGDYIEFGGTWAEIKKIGLRATNVQTFDHADVIIPNADLVSNQVTNWTLTNRKVRLTIPVGVAYGSDVTLVMERLIASPKALVRVAQRPTPQVLFLRFGESSLDFELRAWVAEADDRLLVASELHQEIDRSFREAGIEIAFPQRDLHLRSVDKDFASQPISECAQ